MGHKIKQMEIGDRRAWKKEKKTQILKRFSQILISENIACGLILQSSNTKRATQL